MKNKFDFKLLILFVVFVIALVTIWITGGNRINNLINKKKDSVNPAVVRETDFNLKTLKTVNSVAKNSNYLISPYSMEVALNMLSEGANGNTKTEIESLVGNRKINDITSENVKVANAIFIKEIYKDGISVDYTNTLVNNYNSEILYDEFTKPNVINDWVNKNTDGMIKRILERMDPEFVLGLANAIAIDVKWENQFECQNTRSAEFTNGDNKTNVEMMHQTYSKVKYLKNDNEEGIILPYAKDSNLEFVAIMPTSDLAKYIDELTKEELDELDKSFTQLTSKQELNLELPRFSYSYTLEDFIAVLNAMGIKDAFSSSKADFTNIMTRENMAKNNIDNIYVSQAIHKTYIDLNEVGTKAAAVTYFGLEKATALPIEKEYINISFNKPFMYFIRESKTKEMLFVGTVYEPNVWNGSTCDNLK